MKMKKTLMSVVSVVVIAALAIGGTLAFLTVDGQQKSNIFTSGDISIQLDETVGVYNNGDGGKVTQVDDGAAYYELMPGDTVQKEVTVSNTGKNDAYVRVVVKINNVAEINNAIDEVYENAPYNYGPEEMQELYDYIFNGWGLNYNKVDGEGNALGMRLTITGDDMPEYALQVDSVKTIDEYTNAYNENWYENSSVVIKNGQFPGYYSAHMDTYELMYTYYIALPAGEDTTLFNGIQIPADFNAEQMKMFDGLEIDVYADAIQTANIPTAALYTADADQAAIAAAVSGFAELDAIHPLNVLLGTKAVITTVSTEEELRAAVEKGGTVILIEDIELNADNTVTVPNGKTVVLELNGKTLSATSSVSTSNRNVITVKGDLTIQNGTVLYEHKGTNMEWNASSAILEITAGGVVNVENAEIRNLGGTDMAFVAHLNNWGEVTLNVDRSTLFSTYCAIRVFNSGYDMNNVTVTNSTLAATRALWVHNYTAADFGAKYDAAAVEARLNINVLAEDPDTENTLDNVANLNADANNTVIGSVSYGFTDRVVYYTTSGSTSVAENAADLKEALVAGDYVVIENDVAVTGTVTVAPNGYNEAYGNEIGFAQYGGTFDGNGNTLSSTNEAWLLITHGGTIKNVTIDSGERGIVTYAPTEDIVIDNVVIDGPGYAINTSEHAAVKLIVTNSTLNGWTSFAGLESASFTNCKFGENTKQYWLNMGYDQDYDRLIKPYVDTVIADSEFEQGFYIDLSALGADCTVTIDNCTVGDVVLTAENYDQYITIELPSGRTVADCVIFK